MTLSGSNRSRTFNGCGSSTQPFVGNPRPNNFWNGRGGTYRKVRNNSLTAKSITPKPDTEILETSEVHSEVVSGSDVSGGVRGTNPNLTSFPQLISNSEPLTTSPGTSPEFSRGSQDSRLDGQQAYIPFSPLGQTCPPTRSSPSKPTEYRPRLELPDEKSSSSDDEFQPPRFRPFRQRAVTCLTSMIPDGIKFKRTGLTPYCRKDGVNYYFICVDSKYGSLTDPGGGFGPIEDYVEGAIRELKEETMNIFDFTSPEATQHVRDNSITIHNGAMIMMFQLVEVEDMDRLCRLFRDQYTKAVKNGADSHLIENSHLLWISEPDLRRLVFGGQVKLPPTLRELMKPDSNLSEQASLIEMLSKVSIDPATGGILNEYVYGSDFYPQLYFRVKALLAQVLNSNIGLLSIS